MFLHNRNTGEDFFEIVRKYRSEFSTGVVHSFDGTVEDAKKITDLGLYIGLNGCSLKMSSNLEVIKSLPLDLIMIETDSPWCDIRTTHDSSKLIPDYRPPFESTKKEKFELGKMVKNRNEPCSLPQVLQVIAKIKNVDENLLAEQILKNTNKLFFKK